jgi:O-antigen ligase
MNGDVVLVGAGYRPAPAFAEGATRLRDRERVAVGAAAAAIALLPLLRPAGPGNSAPIDALIVLTFLASLVWLWTARRQIQVPYAIPIGFVLLGGVVGALAGPVPASGIVAVVQDIALVLWFWALVNIASSPKRLRVIIRAWAYAAVVWAVVLLGALAAGVTALSGQTESEGVRTALTFGNPNVAGNYFFISIMVVWATGRPQHRLVRLAGYAALVAALASTGSNGALVALTVGAIVAGLLGLYRRAGVVAAATALTGVALTGAVFASQYSVEDVQSRASRSSYAFIRDGVGRSAKTASDRSVLFHQGIALYHTGGLLGTGPGSTKVRLKDQSAHRVVEAHNDYLAAINERGIIGLLGVVLLLGGLAFQALSLARPPTSPRLAAVIVRPNALAGAFAGALVAMSTTEYLHARHVWTLFAFVVAAVFVARRS